MRKIGELKGKPIVEGNPNEVKNNQIHAKTNGESITLSERKNGNLETISGGSSEGSSSDIEYLQVNNLPIQWVARLNNVAIQINGVSALNHHKFYWGVAIIKDLLVNIHNGESGEFQSMSTIDYINQTIGEDNYNNINKLTKEDFYGLKVPYPEFTNNEKFFEINTNFDSKDILADDIWRYSEGNTDVYYNEKHFSYDVYHINDKENIITTVKTNITDVETSNYESKIDLGNGLYLYTFKGVNTINFYSFSGYVQINYLMISFNHEDEEL